MIIILKSSVSQPLFYNYSVVTSENVYVIFLTYSAWLIQRKMKFLLLFVVSVVFLIITKYADTEIKLQVSTHVTQAKSLYQMSNNLKREINFQ